MTPTQITYVFLVWEEPWSTDPSTMSLEEASAMGSNPNTNMGVFQVLEETQSTLKVFSVLSTFMREDRQGRMVEGVRVIPKSCITTRQRLAGYDEEPDTPGDFDFTNRLN